MPSRTGYPRHIASLDESHAEQKTSDAGKAELRLKIDSSLAKELGHAAQKQGVPVEELAANILQRQSDWRKYELARVEPVPSLLSALFNVSTGFANQQEIPKQDLQKVMKEAAEVAFSFIHEMVSKTEKGYHLWALLEALEENFKLAGLDARHETRAGKHFLVIQHRLGRNESAFIQELLTLVFENLTDATVITSSTPAKTVAELEADEMTINMQVTSIAPSDKPKRLSL
jgi:vancomycin resistance protein YoaR